MALEVFYPNDVRQALLAAEQAVSATAGAMGVRDEPFAAGFLAGYRAALTTLALAFGLVTQPDSGDRGADWLPACLEAKRSWHR